MCEQRDHFGVSNMGFRCQAALLCAEIFREDFRDCQFVAPGFLASMDFQVDPHGTLLSYGAPTSSRLGNRILVSDLLNRPARKRNSIDRLRETAVIDQLLAPIRGELGSVRNR